MENEVIVEKLFFKVFRNKYLRNEINRHLELYSIHWKKGFLENLNQSKYREYITCFTNYIPRKNIIASNFPELSSIIFNDKYNKELTIGLPTTIKELHFGRIFQCKLKNGSIHQGVETLTFGEFYIHEPTIGLLPNSITKLSYQKGFNMNLDVGMLPLHLTELNLGTEYNTEFKIGQLPETIKILHIYGYNQKLNPFCLPLSLEELYASSFNQIIEKESFIKNINLKKIVFGVFNQPFHEKESHCLPGSLTYLNFGHSFNQTVNELPSKLVHLIIGASFDKPIGDGKQLPNSLETLDIGDHFNQAIKVFPSSLTRLKIGTNYKSLGQGLLPETLLELDLSACYYYNLNQIVEQVKFPESILTFKMCLMDKPVTAEMIPINTTHLQLLSTNRRIEFISLPQSIKVIQVPLFFNWSIAHLVGGLTELIFLKTSRFYDQITNNSLPKNLKRLEFSSNWDNNEEQILPGQLPNSIEILKFGGTLKHDLTLDILPTSLKLLTFSYYNSRSLRKLKKNQINFIIKYNLH